MTESLNNRWSAGSRVQRAGLTSDNTSEPRVLNPAGLARIPAPDPALSRAHRITFSIKVAMPMPEPRHMLMTA
jgi:hypothetical protein